jgi:hypothetical protein
MLFDIDTQAGISEHGRVASPLDPSVSCGNWWTDASSQVKRSIFMDRVVYSISDQALQVASVDATSNVLQSLDLEPQPNP